MGAAVGVSRIKGAPDDVVSCDAPLLQQLQDGITAHLSSAGLHLHHINDALLAWEGGYSSGITLKNKLLFTTKCLMVYCT